MKARVYITLKKGVLDPQGRAVMGALKSINFKEVKDLRVGKFIEITISGLPEKEAQRRVNEMCQKLLANPTIEDFRVEMED